MKTKNNTYWKNVVNSLKNNKIPKSKEIDFNNETIGFKDVALLNRFGFRVPENLITYSDDEIAFDDDADVTKDDLESGKISWSVRANFNIEPEIKQWLEREKIEVNSLIPQLMKNFYETMKHIHKNTAL